MTEQHAEAPLTTTLKVGGEKDAPWVVIRSRDAAHLQSQLMELGDGSVATTLGEVTAVFAAHYRVGKTLDAKPMDPQPTNGSNAPLPPAQQPAPQAPPAPPAPPAQMPPAQAPAPQAPPQQQPQQGEGWPPGAHQQPGEWPPAPQQQAPQAPPAPPAPAPQPTALAAPPAVPNAPIVLGRPARFMSGSNGRGPWSAFFDPRSPEELASIPIDPQTNRRVQTDDENDPRLAAGQAEFTRWLR